MTRKTTEEIARINEYEKKWKIKTNQTEFKIILIYKLKKKENITR